ncbi:MAG: T9SS type A sorting domain-containing protein [Chlorobi bacterium]|nr:T9SS type A sorting domain-containing protein [Chlorobiota bacterium]
MKKKVLFLMMTAFLFSFSAMSQCGMVSLIGEFNGWSGDHYLDRDPMNPSSFSTIISLNKNDDVDPLDGMVSMKFRENGDWAVNWGAAEFPSGTAVLDGSDIPVPVDTASTATTDYFVTFNCETGEYNFEEICGSIGLIGEFNGWAGDIVMTRDMDDMSSFSVVLSLTAAMDDDGNDTIEVKFRESADWAVNWGGDAFPSGTAVMDGANILVPLDADVYTTDFLVTFNCVTGEYNFESVCGSIGLIGEFNGWAGDYAMNRNTDDPNEWSVIFSLTPDMDENGNDTIEVKFRESADWTVNWGGADFPSGTGEIDGANILVPLDGTGLTTDYIVTFNCATAEYNFVATSGSVSMIGDFNNWNGDVPMNRDAVNPDLWTLTRSWFADSQVKFRENNDWSVNWGNSGWPTGTAEDNGPNIPLLAGKYDVTFNASTLDYSFVVNDAVCGEIGMVGDFNNWGNPDVGGDPPTDLYLVRDAMYPSNFSVEYNFTSSTSLLFRLDAMPITNDNVWGGTFPMGTGVHDVTQLIQVPGGKYKITFNCLSGDFNFIRLGNAVIASKVFAINVDGNLDENDWNINQPVSQVVDGTPTEDVAEVFFGVTYNEEYLYVGMSVVDSTLVGTEIGEVFVDGNKSGGAYDEFDCHLRFSAAGIEIIQGDSTMVPLLGFVVAADFTGFTAEIGIPWANLGVTPEEGSQIGFDVMFGVPDTLNGGAYTLAWNGGLQNYEGTSSFGDLLFGQLSCGCISLYGETIGDVELRNPTDMNTTYVGTYELFEDMDLFFRKDFQSTVSWSTDAFPEGTAVLDGPAIPGVANRYRVTFDCLTGEYSFTLVPTGDAVAWAQYAQGGVTVDGDLSEYSLDYGSNILAVGDGPNNNTVTWGALWDEGSFYIGVKVVDAVVEGSGNPWDNDAIEMYIDGNHDKDGAYDADFDTQLIMDYVGQSELWIKADGVPITNYESSWAETSDGYNVEVRIGWDNIDFLPGKGRSIGWSLSNNDSDNGIGRDYQTTWYGTGDNWNNTGVLGDLQLAGGPFYFGIDDVYNYNDQVVLYPNPTNGNVFLRLNNEVFNGDVTILVLDISGRVITTQTETIMDSGNTVKVNTNSLNSGIYFVNIVTEDGAKAVKKLIVE